MFRRLAVLIIPLASDILHARVSNIDNDALNYRQVNNVARGITHRIRQGNATVKPVT